MDRKTYIRDIYSKYWLTAREKKYGFSAYDINLCNLLLNFTNHIPCNKVKLLEAAIGTGYPFADFFQRKGYSVHGVDISPDLIKKCHTIYPRINAVVGDAELLNYPDDIFDITYCFHSTWYFPNLGKAICEMVRVTRPGGYILFDIQNRSNQSIERIYKKRLSEMEGIGRLRRYAENIVKVILQRGFPDWHFVVHETPTYPQDVYKYLNGCKYSNTFTVYIRNENDTLESKKEISSLERYGRLVFVVSKAASRK